MRSSKVTDLPMNIADASARTSALNLSQHVLVQAPAGSGKTGLLIQRMLKALATVEQPESVVALTFTRKAAGEIRERLLEALASAESERPSEAHEQLTWDLAQSVLQRDRNQDWDLRANPQRLRTMTLDALNAELADRLPLTSGTGGPLQASEDANSLYRDALLGLFSGLDDVQQPESLRDALAALLQFADNRLEKAIDLLLPLLQRREQWQFELLGADGHSNEDFVQQSERVIQNLLLARMRAVEATIDPAWRQQVVECFCQSTREDVPEPIRNTIDWPRVDQAQISAWRWMAQMLLTKDLELRKPRGINKNLGFPPKADSTLRIKELFTELQEHPQRDEAEAALAAIVGAPPASYPADMAVFGRQLVEVLRFSLAHLKLVFGRSASADFVEIGQRAIAALEAHTDREDDGGNLGNRQRVALGIQHLLVDEMQDTSASQMRLLEQLTQDWELDDGHSLFLVGDPMQSIYAFRQAEVRLFLELWQQRALNHLPLVPLQLQCNFRSRPAVVDWCNDVFAEIFPERASLHDDAVPYAAAMPVRAFTPSSGIKKHCIADGSKEQEAAITAKAVANILHHEPNADIAILIRSRSHSVELLSALREEQISFSCQEIDRLAGSAAISDALALAYALQHSHDLSSWGLLLRGPLVGLCWADLLMLVAIAPKGNWPQRIARMIQIGAEGFSGTGMAAIARLFELYTQAIARLQAGWMFYDTCRSLWASLGGAQCVAAQDLDDLNRYWQLLADHSPNGLLEQRALFEQKVDALYATAKPGQVQILTIHKAKGLEFDHVFLFGCNRQPRRDDKDLLQYRRLPQGYLIAAKPGYKQASEESNQLYEALHKLRSKAAIQERFRLLYVAATRARECLHIVGNFKLDKNAEAAPTKNCFGEDLFPWLRADIQAVEQSSQEALPFVPPLVRQSNAWVFPPEKDFPAADEPIAVAPSQLHSDGDDGKESESLVAAAHRSESELNRDLAILAGTIYHQAMERIAQEGVDRWSSMTEQHQQAIEAGLRRMGQSDEMATTAAPQIRQLIQSTLDHEQGRWVLAQRSWAKNEFRISGYQNNRWINAVVDRCFEEEQAIWIIDYKVTLSTITDRAAHIEKNRRQYSDQLNAYAQLLKALRPGKTVRTALYLPAVCELVEL